MEVVPTGDGDDDDGVIWFRCPQCQGFLPKLSGADLKGDQRDGALSQAMVPVLATLKGCLAVVEVHAA